MSTASFVWLWTVVLKQELNFRCLFPPSGVAAAAQGSRVEGHSGGSFLPHSLLSMVWPVSEHSVEELYQHELWGCVRMCIYVCDGPERNTMNDLSP